VKRVLVADDDSEALERVATVARAEGYEVLTAGDGQSALESARSLLPDLVLLDVTLPVFGGLEVCELLRNDPEVPKTLPIVLMTEDELESRQIERVEASACVRKRMALAELRELLLEHLGVP
jgi:CheY-like chemotaxis protein